MVVFCEIIFEFITGCFLKMKILFLCIVKWRNEFAVADDKHRNCFTDYRKNWKK